MKPELSGGCLCGAIRYVVNELPFVISHCHCEDCRRSTGAPFVTWGSIYGDQLSVIRGALREVEFAGRVRSFCGDCGTQILFADFRGAEQIDFTISSLDDPGALIPEDHTWTVDQLPWIALADGLPRHTRES